MNDRPDPLRVAIVNDYELVVAGVAALLAPYADQVAIIELDSSLPVVSDVDVILYDTFGQVQGDGVDLEDLVQGSDARVVIFSWNVQALLVESAVSRGAGGYLSKSLSAPQIVDALLRVHRGEIVVPVVEGTPSPDDGSENGTWPGHEHGLTAREAEVIALITQGLSNQDIAQRSYLSINSVKTYIRTAYRKMGVDSRSRAVLWGIHHGFEPDVMRSVDDSRDRRLDSD